MNTQFVRDVVIRSIVDELPQSLAPDSLVGEAKAAQILDVTPRALQAWRQRGGGPIFVKISKRCIRYRLRDLHAWCEARLARSTVDVRANNSGDGVEDDARSNARA